MTLIRDVADAQRDPFLDAEVLPVPAVWTSERKRPALDADARIGLAGEVLAAVAPHTEADPVAVLVTFLVAFGCLVGRSPYVRKGNERHDPRLFVAVVGDTSAGAKGTSWAVVRLVLEHADREWLRSDRVLPNGGLSSGEGIIHAVRDATKTGRTKATKDKPAEDVIDPGVDDKRLLVVETELERTFAVMTREGNTLAAIVRGAWDSGTLRTLTKQAYGATGAHVCIVGHITPSAIRRVLTAAQAANGFGNRFAWFLVHGGPDLPDGDDLPESVAVDMGRRVREAAEAARRIGRVTLDDAATALWKDVYANLRRRPPGLFGELTARARPQVIRLALVYALLDASPVIGVVHLRAALAVWRYGEDSARAIWGDSLAKDVSDKLLGALRAAFPKGITREQCNRLFGGHRGPEVAHALPELEHAGLARHEHLPSTGGRPAELWFATPELS